jgi:hypothetical protein
MNVADVSGGVRVPDAITPVTGFRSWAMGLGQLWSPRCPDKVRWPRLEPLHATCRRHGALGFLRPGDSTHDAPAPDCRCGIYGTFDPWGVDLSEQRHPWTLVVGRVEAWGRVVLGDKGFRAAAARPLQLYSLPSYDDRTMRTLHSTAQAYGIPVRPWDAALEAAPAAV